MVVFTRNVKKIKGAAHKNGDVGGTCKRCNPDVDPEIVKKSSELSYQQ